MLLKCVTLKGAPTLVHHAMTKTTGNVYNVVTLCNSRLFI